MKYKKYCKEYNKIIIYAYFDLKTQFNCNLFNTH